MFDTINNRVGYDTVGGLPLMSFTTVDPRACSSPSSTAWTACSRSSSSVWAFLAGDPVLGAPPCA